MEDDVKTRFDDLDKRLASTEKRIDDIKWFIGGTTGIFTIIFGLLTFIANSNFNNEKTSIREDVRDFKAQLLGLAQQGPQLELFNDDGVPLRDHDQEINPTFEVNKNGRLQMTIHFIIKNSGDALSGPMSVKIYSKSPLRLGDKSTDEHEYQYEDTFSPSSLDPDEIPGKFSFTSYMHIDIPDQKRPAPGSYPALAKVFYGKGKVAQGVFSIHVSQQ